MSKTYLLNTNILPFTISSDDDYKQYLKNKNWRCSKSPTKAHYWKISDDKMTCKYCGNGRNIDKVQIRTILEKR